MNKGIVLKNILFSLLLCAVFANAKAQKSIDLDFVIQETVANNPQIKVSLQNVSFTEGSYRIARSTFNTNIFLTGQSRRDLVPTSFESGGDPEETNYWAYSMSASKKIGFGTVITPTVGVFNAGQNIDGVAANQGTAFISLEQPILRGLGTGYNTAQLKVAELEINSQQHLYFFDASSYLLNSLSAYIEYISSQRNLAIQLDNEKSMQETVDQTSRLVELDAIPSSELVVSKANLANQHTNTVLAENRLAFSQNNLATTMGITLEEVKSIGPAPLEFPMSTSGVIIGEEYPKNWFQYSLSLRHDYLATVNDIEASVIGLDFTKKGLRPTLNLIMGAGYNGVYRSEALQQYYRPFMSNIPGMNYSLGLRFDIAPRYDLQRGQHVQAMAKNEAAQASLDYIKLQMNKEIQKDCDQIKYLLEAVESVNEAVEFSEKALENEKKKLDLGFSTAFNVAFLQNNYLRSLERQNALFEQLNQTIILFKHHTGTLVNAKDETSFTVNTNNLFLLFEAP